MIDMWTFAILIYGKYFEMSPLSRFFSEELFVAKNDTRVQELQEVLSLIQGNPVSMGV